ncbi:MAG: nuclear transport factor 2 family protein [Pseudomonadales bacterium]
MEFSDFAAITRLRYQYAYSLDSRDWELHRQLYTEQIEMDFSSYSGGDGAVRMEADAWVDGLKPLFSGLSATQHVMTNPLVDVQGDRATQKMYMQAEHFLLEDGVQREFAIGGYYDDQLRRTATGWRIEAVKLTVLWRRGDAEIMVRARQLSGA